MRFTQIIAAMFLGALLLGACQNEKKAEPKKGPIENLTHTTAQKAVKMIKTPINKAKAAAEMENRRAKDFEKADQNP